MRTLNVLQYILTWSGLVIMYAVDWKFAIGVTIFVFSLAVGVARTQS